MVNHPRHSGRSLRQYPVRFLRESLSALREKMVPGALTHVATRETVAALTFDDGPHPQSTPAVLAVLEQYQVHATFFMLVRGHSTIQTWCGRWPRQGILSAITRGTIHSSLGFLVGTSAGRCAPVRAL